MEAVYDLGDFTLQSGVVLPDAKLAYETHGTLNDARDNVVVYTTWASGRHADNAPFVGEGMALDPSQYFIVVPDMFTNGLSSSPSNTSSPFDGPRFPLVTPYDNVIAQHHLLTKHFDVTRVQLVVGLSMSGQQAFHWGGLYPDLVARICSICGSAKTSPHNGAYLTGLQAIFEGAAGWDDGECETWPPGLLRAIIRIAIMMALSQDFFERENTYASVDRASRRPRISLMRWKRLFWLIGVRWTSTSSCRHGWRPTSARTRSSTATWTQRWAPSARECW